MAQSTYPPVADVARVDFIYVSDTVFPGVEWQWSHYWRDTTVTRDYAYLVGLGGDFADAWQNPGSWQDVLPNDVVLDRVRVVDLDTTAHLTATVFQGIAAAGGTSPRLPLTVAAVIRLPGETATDPLHSYMRFGPLAEASVTGNNVSSSTRTELQDAYSAFSTAIAALQATGEMVIVSAFEPGGTPPNIYRDNGSVNTVATGLATCRTLIGRAASRQK